MRSNRANEAPCTACAFERVASVEFRNIGEDLKELKARVGTLEATLARGVMLLIANLAVMVVHLVQRLLAG
jgi:hypothetical protein